MRLVERAVEAIRKAAGTGKIGDGKIFVTGDRAGDAHPHRRVRHRSAVIPRSINQSDNPEGRHDETQVQPAARRPWGGRHAAAAGARLAADEKPKLDTGDTAWMLTSTALVLMMTIPGLALFYGGMVRKKNVLATVMQSFAVTCLVTVLWLIVGYSLAFTPRQHRHRRAEPRASCAG